MFGRASSFGGTTSFGPPADGSVFGGTSTGLFRRGSTRIPPFCSETAFASSSSSAIGSQVATPTFGWAEFGNSPFGVQHGGSRVAPFTPTENGEMLPRKLQSICGMTVPVYNNKSHEELRWGDYQWGDKGGPNHAGLYGVSASPFGIPRPTFESSPFGFTPAQTSTSGTASHPSPPSFGSSIFRSSMPWGAQSQSVFRASSDPGSGLTTPAFGATSTPAFGSTPTSAFLAERCPIFGSGLTTPAFGSTPTAGFGAPSCPIFGSGSTTPAFGSTPTAAFGATSSPFFGSGSTTPAFSSTPTAAFGAASSNLFGSGGAFGASCSSSLSFGSSPAFGPSETAFRSNPFGSGSYGAHTGSQVATPTVGRTEFGNSSFEGQPRGSHVGPFTPTSIPIDEGTGERLPSKLQSIGGMTVPVYKCKCQEALRWEDYQLADKGGPNHSGQSGADETSGVCSLGNLGQAQAAGTGGFGSQNDFGQSQCGQSSNNGSSSDVQAALAINPVGTLPALQQLSIGCTETSSSVQYGISSMPVPFSYDGDNTPGKPEANAQVIPRGNPRSLVIGPEYRPAREQEPSPLKKTSPCANDGVSKDGDLEEQTNFVKASQKMKGVHDDCSLQNDEEYVIIKGVKGAGESSIGYDCGAGIEELMPKLCQPDYYTEPHVKELAAKERAEPGFFCRVKDFVIGRLGYGHIKFAGETDVRRLDVDSLVRFNNHEVILYTDESKKPSMGQRLNKPAEVTLLDMKCIDKKTGKQYIEGPKVEKYKDMLKKAAEEQGAEFVSYDPIKGEWKFKVRHFSGYDLTEEQD